MKMADCRARNFLHILICSLVFVRTEALYVGITYLTRAVAKGAVCLDGSPPAYHLHRGSGTGINSWLVHMEGGGWCNNVTNCLSRKNTRLGSSRKMVKRLAFSGILSNNPIYNPDFYNWNRVKIRYCDGSSFTGDVESVNPATKLHFRGARIWLAVIEELVAQGMGSAENAIASGCSAGGLTSILHCDSFRALLPMGTQVKCLSDAGYFVNVPDVSGGRHLDSYFKQIVELHGSVRNLPSHCTTRTTKPHLCFFPQYVSRTIRTPLFILNAAYDSWQVCEFRLTSSTSGVIYDPECVSFQIKNALAPVSADPRGHWSDCKLDIKSCSAGQLKAMQGFRLEFLSALYGLGRSVSRGFFINSCFTHCQTEMQDTWFRSDSPRLTNTTIAKAVGDWFYDRIPFQQIDCPYPCDRTCHNRVSS